MNIIAKGMPMSVDQAVQQIASAFADAEKRDRQTLNDFKGLRSALKVIKDAGHIGAIRALSAAAELESLASRHKAEKLAVHHQLTEEAKALGIDIPGAPNDDGEIIVMGGGDR